MSQIVGLGTAQPGHVLTGDTFTSGSGANQQGSMPNNGGLTLTASGTGTVQIPQGYHDGTGKVAQVTVPAANVLAGTTIAGVAGTMPENGALGTITPGTAAKNIPAGHTTGGTVAGDANLVAGNIKSGISIFGVTGSVTPFAAPTGGTQSYTTPGSYTFTVPSNVTRLLVEMWGAGGGGGGGSSAGPGTGGGGGAYLAEFLDVNPGQQFSVTVGGGGAGGAGITTFSPGNAGSAGGASSFGSYSAAGGAGGHGGINNTAVAATAGGAAPATDSNTLMAWPGGQACGYTSNSIGYGTGGGGAGAMGGAGGLSGSNGLSQQTGTGTDASTGHSYGYPGGKGGSGSPAGGLLSSGGSGGYGQEANTTTPPAAGGAYGGGGGGNCSTSSSSYSFPGGRGADGAVIIHW